jgi:hypothetical protein
MRIIPTPGGFPATRFFIQVDRKAYKTQIHPPRMRCRFGNGRKMRFCNNKEKQTPSFPANGYFSVTKKGSRISPTSSWAISLL